MATSWGYKKAFMRCACIFLAGTALQLCIGDLNNAFLHYPWSVIAALFYAYLLYLIYYLSDKYPALRKLYDHYACVSALASMVLITIFFGSIAQNSEATGFLSKIGFTRMTSSWGFNLLLLYFTSTLGLGVINDFAHIKQKKWVSVLSHLCVFVILTAGIFGSADKKFIELTASLNKPTSTGVVEDTGEAYDLPFEITLKKFEIEEYPPRLRLINMQDRNASKQFLSIEQAGLSKTFGDWDITVDQFLTNAMPDTVGYRAMSHVGSAPAAFVTATNRLTKATSQGWITSGSFIFEPERLQLTPTEMVSMSPSIPKHYQSDVHLVDKKGNERDLAIEVNTPAQIGYWQIYQYSYDTERGKYSTISIFECVHDAWYSIVQVALWLLLLAGVLMFFTAGRRRKENQK